MVKALAFKGDKKSKKRKRTNGDGNSADPSNPSASALVPSAAAADYDKAAADDNDNDNLWVSAEAASDVSGPVIFVLPTLPATCLACDANGSVFASAIENMIESEPGTAEPHDVRQVWIANRVAGTESFSFKGHHGKYLGVDKFGIPTATRDAISPEESFLCMASEAPASTGTFAIRTVREKYLSVSATAAAAVEIRADADVADDDTQLRIRMQARFKPKLAADKVERAREKISRAQIEAEVGRKLDDADVKKLKRARRDGTYHEAMLDVKVKGKHDKYA